jgi:hypothetical protein
MFMKKILFGLFILMVNFTKAQQILSPDAFLNYELGSRYTPHHRIVSYCELLAKAAPDRCKLFEYGKTNEGKPLLMLAISSYENINKLEEIRKNNLRMSGFLNDKSSDLQLPAVIWLSYNVHGNEPSSSEVAMKLAFSLLQSKGNELSVWLKNTVVLIDPCLNPDGRDRYVNWINSVVEPIADATPWAVEHDEPWPGGRTNHYLFDLNRDWAWQTQVESQQRMKLYHEWMPTIHVDFHEQYPENPYYFAPAAAPYHPAISNWQSQFQVAIGKNHARYFDQNGWLYFTKEVFDLFYPSYGDTYPIFSGAVGMTYEQAGHSPGGLAIAVHEDTLTLKDRIDHHYTTSISTIETVSKNATAVNKAFADYFNSTLTSGSGAYGTYIIRDASPDKQNAIIQLLNKNKIQYGRVKAKQSFKGYRYGINKEVSFTTTEGDLVITTRQPKGVLARVLFEPNAMLSDSITYDITSWPIPLAYGVDAYAIKEFLTPLPISSSSISQKSLPKAYGYLIEYNDQSDARLLSKLLQMGARVRYSEKDFSTGGKSFKKGTLIVLSHENSKHIESIQQILSAVSEKVTVFHSGMVDTGSDMGSEKIKRIKQAKIALLTGSGFSPSSVGDVWNWMKNDLNYPVSLVNADRLAEDVLKDIDVLIVVDGKCKLLAEKEGILKNWVRGGGKLIAFEGSINQMIQGEWGVKLLKESDAADFKSNSSDSHSRYEDREKNYVSKNTPGAIFAVELDNSHPLAFGYDSVYYSLKMNDLLLDFTKDGWNVGTLKSAEPISGFVGAGLKSKLKKGVLFGVQDFGSGKIIYFTDTPIFRNFWENGSMLLANAIFMVQ